MQGLLQGMMNPAQADVLGNVRAGQAVGKKKLSDELVGDILSKTLGGKLGALGKLDGEKAMALAGAFGVPLNNKQRLQSMIGDVQLASTALKAGGPMEAAKVLAPKVQTLSGLGIEPTQYMDMVKRLSNPETAEAAGQELLELERVMLDSGIIKSPDGKVKASAKTRDFPNGTVMQTRSNGSVVVIDPEGNEVKDPAERRRVLKEARAADISDAKEKSGAREAGKEAIKVSSAAFERIEGINKSIANIDEGIRLLDEGADTGPIMSKLPSIKAASIQLDNLQNRLGLDVIGETTFGALSTGELTLALNTGLPKNLEPAELKQWLKEKGAAQRKLSNYLSDVAVFLGTPGNTVADWITSQREIQADAPPSSSRFQIEVVE